MPTYAQPVAGYTWAYSRILMQQVVDALAAVGWQRSEAGGQVDIPTASTATGAIGFLLFESTDELSDVAPIYLRIQFNNLSHGSMGYCAMLDAFIGFELDPITGFLNSSLTIPLLASSASFPQSTGAGRVESMFASGDGGSLRFCSIPEAFAYSSTLRDQGVHAHAFFTVARTKDAEGNPTAEGVVVCMNSVRSTNASTQMVMGTNLRDTGITVQGSRGLCPIMTEVTNTSGLSPSPGQVASVGGLPQLQHPWACTPRLYPYEDVAYLTSFSAASVGDIMNVQVGAELKKYLFLGRAGPCPSTVGSWGSTSAVTATNGDLFVDAGIAILWE